jgi:uncharacterized membrane protein (DUF2068 family)
MSDKGNDIARPHRHKGVLLIAILKLLKGALLFVIGLGAISLVGRDVSGLAEQFMKYLHIDPTGKFFYGMMDKLSFVDDHRLHQLSAGTFFYSAVMLTEGFGLLFEKRWAEWMTVFVTASFIPFEVYEIVRHVNIIKIAVLVLNIAIVIYLIFRLRDKTDGHQLDKIILPGKDASGEPQLW